MVAEELIDGTGRAELGPYPYDKGEGGFVMSPDTSEEAWDSFKAYLVRVHRATMRAIREAPAAVLDGELKAWKIPMGRALVWLCGHDSYHTAQIRNMGLASLRGTRIY